MRNLVGLETQCEVGEDCDTCALPAPSGEIVYGEQGPKGETGNAGARGASGLSTFTTTLSTFIMPAIGSLASVTVFLNTMFVVDARVYMEGVGYFRVDSLTGSTQMSLENLGGASNLPVGALVGAGVKVSDGGQRGWDVEANTAKRFAIVAQKKTHGTHGGQMKFQLGVSSGGTAPIENLSEIVDADSIVTLGGSSNFAFKLPSGAWRIRARQPFYNVNKCKVYIMECIGTSTSFALTFFNRGNFTLPDGIIRGVGNGFAGKVADGANRTGVCIADAVVNVSAPDRWFVIWCRSSYYSNSDANRAASLGFASDFDDGVATPVDELYTVVEIDEM